MKYVLFFCTIFCIYNLNAGGEDKSSSSTSSQETKPSTQEAHIYWSNRVTNVNKPNTSTEFKTETATKKIVVVDEETYKRIKAELLELLKQQIKKELREELKKEILNELMLLNSKPRFTLSIGR